MGPYLFCSGGDPTILSIYFAIHLVMQSYLFLEPISSGLQGGFLGHCYKFLSPQRAHCTQRLNLLGTANRIFPSSGQPSCSPVVLDEKKHKIMDKHLQSNGLGNEETLAFPKNFSPNPVAESECKHVQYHISQMTPSGRVCNLSPCKVQQIHHNVLTP